MGLFSRRRKRKNALRTPDNYTAERMAQDHVASTALFVATMPGVHPSVDVAEQEREAEREVEDTVPTPEPEPEPDPEPTNESYSYEAPEYEAPVTEVYQPSYDTGSSYDSGSSYSYDSGSSSSYDSGSSSSFDSGGSFDSGSY